MEIVRKFLAREGRFVVLIGLFILASLYFYDRPQIAMWIGFGLAGYSAVSNDSIQTLGTFIASNKKVPWWILWLFIGGTMAVVLVYGWYSNGGDISYGRLESIAEPSSFNFIQLLAPIMLLVLTRFRMPVSTTFLLLSVFSSSKTVSAMLNKTFIGYFVAFMVAIAIWAIVGELAKKKFLFKEHYNKNVWRVLQWVSTVYLWTSWLMQDLANTAVYLPRVLPLNYLIIVIAFLFFGLGIILFTKGGRIQRVIDEKTDVVDIRSATIIDLVYATILVVFKQWNHMPMSTTWVFLGLLAGREFALSRFSGHKKPYTKTLGLVMKDLAFAGIGLLISLGIAWFAMADFSFSELLQTSMFWK